MTVKMFRSTGRASISGARMLELVPIEASADGTTDTTWIASTTAAGSIETLTSAVPPRGTSAMPTTSAKPVSSNMIE